MSTTATISECGTYRYTLERSWAGMFDQPRTVNFIMLNPSTADATLDDPTIRRCIGFAKSWGFTGLVVTNLFAVRATDPKVMLAHPDPVGPENDRHIEEVAEDAAQIVCAWGNHGSHKGRDQEVLKMLRNVGNTPHFLKMSKTGQPWHPLYLPADLTPTPWR